MKMNSDQWRVLLMKEIQKLFDNPSWFDWHHDGENPISLIEKDGLENEITPGMIAGIKYNDFKRLMEQNDLKPIEVREIIDEILPQIEKAVADHITKLHEIPNKNKLTNVDFVNSHRALLIAPHALLRFRDILVSKLETHRDQLNIPGEVESIEENILPEIELKNQKEQIRLLCDLGVLAYLREKYPAALLSNNQLSQLVAQILNENKGSVQPTVNALMTEQVGRNYAKQTDRTKSIIDSLNASESK